MPESTETTEIVKNTSDGMVKITIEKYEDLMKKAAEKPPIVRQEVVRNVTKVVKTPEIQAQDNIVAGYSLMTGGGCVFVIGLALFLKGRGQQAKLSG